MVPAEIRRLFGGRDWRGQTIAFVGVGLGAMILGFAAGSLGRQLQSTRLARAEAANVELRESVATLEEAVRQGRGPLERRVHELEQLLAESSGAAAAEASEADEQRTRIAELEARLEKRQSGASERKAEIKRLERAVKQAERGRGELAAENERLARKLASLESGARPRAAAPLPAAPAPSFDAPAAREEPAPSTAAGDCRALEDPAFALAVGDAERRFAGRLELRLAEAPGGLALEIGEGRYALDPLPQHVSIDCAGTSYIVSVCSAGAGDAVAGVIKPAESWRDPCR